MRVERSTCPRHCRVTFVAVLVKLALVCAGIDPVRHADASEVTQEVESLHAAGAMLYHAGKFRQAIEKYQKAYNIYPDPTLLYNMGRCYEAIGDVESALDLYKRLIDQHADLSDKLRRKTSARMEILRRAQRELKESANPRETTALPAVGGAQTEGEPGSSPGPNRSAATEPRTSESKSAFLAPAKWTAAGLGLASLVGGAVAIILGHADHSEVQDAIDQADAAGVAPMSQARAEELSDDGRTKKVIGYALTGAGAALGALSAVFFYLDHAGERADSMDSTGAGKATRSEQDPIRIPHRRGALGRCRWPRSVA